MIVSSGVALASFALAQPLGINAGGTGNLWGLPSQYAVIKNSTTGTVANKLTKYVYSYSPFTTKAQVANTSDTSIVGVCVANCGGSQTFTSATVQTGGYVDCIFDGATTVGDFVQISSAAAGDCTDAGAAPPTSGQVIGQVMTANAGAGTSSTVQLSLTPSTVDACVSCKCVPSTPVICQTQNPAPPMAWTPICTCTLGPFAHDPGPGNTWIDIEQNVIDFTNGTPPASAIDFQLSTSCPMNPKQDPHGLPASSYAAGTRYPNSSMLGLLNFTTADPLYPNGCTATVSCAAGPPGTGTFTINPSSRDANNVAVGTGFLLKACVFDNR